MTDQTTTLARNPAAPPPRRAPAPMARQRLPRIAAHVFLHARRRPGCIAIMRGPTPISYGALAQDLAAIIRAVDAFNLPPGATAAIAHEDPYIQLLLVFACEALGIATGSFRPQEGPECHALLNHADLVFTPTPIPQTKTRQFTITETWLATALANPPPHPPHLVPAHPHDIEVIFRSSGTTGAPKSMALTHAALRARLRFQRNPATGLGLTPTSRYLALMHFAVGSTYMAAANLLRLGGTFMFPATPTPAEPALPAAHILKTLRPTHLTLMPFQLRALLATLPAFPQPLLPALTLQTIGARLPRDLRQATLQTLAGRVRDTYGTNEIGTIGRLDETGAIALAPGVELAIVDETGQPLPAGQPGTIRLRSPGMAHAYLQDPAATAAMFTPHPQGGPPWFEPGDLGILTPENRLRLIGRQDDLLNLGGKKILSTDLEAQIRAAIPVADIAVLQPVLDSAAGLPAPLVICTVPAPNTKPETLTAHLTPLIAFPFRIHLLPSLPRTPDGKLQRQKLRDAIG